MITDNFYLGQVMNAVLAEACACLAGTTYGVPATCKLYHGAPPDDCCDFLAVWLERVRPTNSFPADYSGSVRNASGLHGIADIAIKLTRSCWPPIVDNALSPWPATDLTDSATSALLNDATALWCCMIGAAEIGALSVGDCNDVKIGHLDPIRPQGGCAGWTFRISVELDACC